MYLRSLPDYLDIPDRSILDVVYVPRWGIYTDRVSWYDEDLSSLDHHGTLDIVEEVPMKMLLPLHSTRNFQLQLLCGGRS